MLVGKKGIGAAMRIQGYRGMNIRRVAARVSYNLG
jgi:hypothetical protein